MRFSLKDSNRFLRNGAKAMRRAQRSIGIISGFVRILACDPRHKPASEADAATDNPDVVYCVGDPGPPCFCLPKDGAPACRVDAAAGGPCTCGAGAQDAGVDEPDDAADAAVTDAIAAESASGPFIGTWTLTGTESFVCSTESAQADPVAATVTFSRGPGATDADEVNLLFDAGLGCSLAMFVSGGVARLVSAPQTCALRVKPSFAISHRSRCSPWGHPSNSPRRSPIPQAASTKCKALLHIDSVPAHRSRARQRLSFFSSFSSERPD